MACCVLLLQTKNLKWCFWLYVRKIASNPIKKKAPDVIKEQFLDSLIGIENEDELGLGEVVKNTKEPEEAIRIIKRY